MFPDALLVAGVGAVLLILARVVVWLFKKKPSDQLFESVQCPGCGWRGRVSRYAGRCPQCNQPLGEQKAKRGA